MTSRTVLDPLLGPKPVPHPNRATPIHRGRYNAEGELLFWDTESVVLLHGVCPVCGEGHPTQALIAPAANLPGHDKPRCDRCLTAAREYHQALDRTHVPASRMAQVVLTQAETSVMPFASKTETLEKAAANVARLERDIQRNHTTHGFCRAYCLVGASYLAIAAVVRFVANHLLPASALTDLRCAHWVQVSFEMSALACFVIVDVALLCYGLGNLARKYARRRRERQKEAEASTSFLENCSPFESVSKL